MISSCGHRQLPTKAIRIRPTFSPKYLFLKITEMEVESYAIIIHFAIRNTTANLTHVCA